MILYTNNARSTLAAGISAGDTALTVATGHGDRFPEVVAPDVAYITLENTGGVREIIKVTSRTSGSDVMTIVRAQNGTAAAAWISGDTVAHRVIALELGRYETLGNVDDADSKADPVDADYLPLKDSAASNGLKRVTWANVKATLKAYFDTLYAKVGAVTGTGITMATGKLLGRGTAATGAIEELTVGTGLAISGTTLNCTVTSDVTSVAGETGEILAAELIVALNAEGGIDADTVGGVAASSFQQGGVTAGTYYYGDLVTTQSTLTGSWVKHQSVRVAVAGTVRVRFSAINSIANNYVHAQARIYINGVAAGTARQTNYTETLYTEDFTVAAGDLIQLYLYDAVNATLIATGLQVGIASPTCVPCTSTRALTSVGTPILPLFTE